jgi:hypothetical protein
MRRAFATARPCIEVAFFVRLPAALWASSWAMANGSILVTTRYTFAPPPRGC